MNTASEPKTCSLRLFDGDLDLTIPELYKATSEIKLALEMSPPERTKANLRTLLAVAECLIADQVN